MNSVQFGWKTFKDITKCLWEWCCSFTRQPIPIESVLHECLSRTRCGTRCCWSCYCSSLAFVLSWCLSLELKLLFDSKRVAGLSDCPIYLEDPDVLQAAACYSELTHWDSCDSSCTTGSTLNLKLSLLKRSKVWIRQVLKVIQQQPKRPKFFSLCSYQKMAIKL